MKRSRDRQERANTLSRVPRSVLIAVTVGFGVCLIVAGYHIHPAGPWAGAALWLGLLLVNEVFGVDDGPVPYGNVGDDDGRVYATLEGGQVKEID